jgi:dTDP-6-deoxy-L-talose 4-dehydrogenase (NAD+)
MKILITGANGYIASYVAKALLDKGAQVLALDFNNNNIDKRADFISCDIFDFNGDIYKELGSPDICLHFAWKDGFMHNSQAHMQMLSGHCKFIEALADGGIKRLVIMGTMHEVGYWEGVIDENTPCNPLSMYGIAKDALRRYSFLLSKQKGFKFQWLRAFYIYGDDERNNSIFQKLLLAAKEGKTAFPFTTGKNRYDFININDLARQISAVAMQEEVGGIINCCSGKPVSLAQKVEEFIKENNLSIKLQYGAFPDRPYDSPIIYGDNGKIERIMRGK